MPQLRLTEFRLTDFIPWSCSCEAKAPARAPGGAGFKGQRPLRTVSPPLEANSASPACYCWSHPRCSSLSLSAVSERAVRFSPAFLSSGGVVCCWLAAWCCSQCEPRKARRAKSVLIPSLQSMASFDAAASPGGLSSFDWLVASSPGVARARPRPLPGVPAGRGSRGRAPCALFRLHLEQIQLRRFVVGRTLDAPPCPCQ